MTFNADSSLLITSLDEVVTGTFTFDSTVDKGTRHPLFLSVLTDNQLSDCDGNTDSSAGDSGTAYLSFPTDDIMRVYQTESGDDLVDEFTRVIK